MKSHIHGSEPSNARIDTQEFLKRPINTICGFLLKNDTDLKIQTNVKGLKTTKIFLRKENKVAWHGGTHLQSQ